MVVEFNTSSDFHTYGILKGHTGWITKICVSSIDPDTLITSSRDKSILVWRLYPRHGEMCGFIKKSLEGHNHFVSDINMSRDGGFLISGSWDKTLRLWDINRAVTKRTFIGHTNDVTSVAFSMDNRQIVSGSRDRSVRLWNTLAVQKFSFEENGHADCVSTVLTLPQSKVLKIFSSGWDRVIKVWGLNPTGCSMTYRGHKGIINSMSISPDGSLLASGSKDGTANLWNLRENRFIENIPFGGSVNSVAFNPEYHFFAAAVGSSVKLYHIKSQSIVANIEPTDVREGSKKPLVTTFCWSTDGSCLFVGYTDHNVRVFHVGDFQLQAE